MERQLRPATVLVSVTPESKVDRIQTIGHANGEERFRCFIAGCLLDASGSGKVPDNWLFRYDFPDKERLPSELFRSENGSPFYMICHAAAQQKIRPTQIVTLREAYYCQKEGIDPLSLDAETKSRIGLPSEYGRDDLNRFPFCRAVDTGHGVLLYDISYKAGQEAYQSLLQHCADHFFDPDMNMEEMRIYDLHRDFDFTPLVEHAETLNFNFHYRAHGFSMQKLFGMSLLDPEILREGVLRKSYDMRPLSENYSQFMTRENVSLYNTHHTFSIAILDHITRNGYPTWELDPQWLEICPLSAQFRDLSARIVPCEDSQVMESLQRQACSKAAELLEEYFPNRRKAPCPELEQTVEQRIYHVQESPHVSNRLKM